MVRSVSCWIIRATLVFGCGVAAEDSCYPPGAVAGIVVATAVVTCVVGGLSAATAWKFWWTPRWRRAHPNAETSQQQHRHQPQKSSADFAFDNPYFRNQEGDDGAGKHKSSLTKNSLRSSKQSENSTKGKKSRGGRNHLMFGGGKKQKALDDTCLTTVERTFVNLRGHDFTGLGFNICGNMRDGILVKDVLHRGPASESGLIKAGDKIVNVTVSFTNIVYEDALTILSYASPYDVQLEIERTPEDRTRVSPSASRKLGSCSFSSSGQKLFHPLYRSQSIDDLTQIDREGPPTGPRRSQSVGVAAHRLRGPEDKTDERALALSATGSLNEKMLATVMAEGTPHKGALLWEKRFEDTLESDDPEKTPEPPRKDAEKTPERPQKDSRQYLDFPPTRRALETRMVLDESDINEVRPRPEDSSNQRASRTSRRTEDDNDSDVSKDSLEVSQRGYQKRKNQTDVGQTSQRPYGRPHTSSEEALSKDGGHSDVPPKPSALYRKSPYGGERQKLTAADALTQSYGCGNRSATVNGEVKVQVKQPGHVVSDGTDKTYQHKFPKKTMNPAGGMFTQINPFQMPSRQKQAGFKPRGFRDEQNPVSNGDFPPVRHGPSSVLIKQSRTDPQTSHGGTYHPQH